MRSIVLVLFLTALVLPSAAQDQTSASDLKGFRAEFIGQMVFTKGRVLELEQAVPQKLFTWRPARGVRSVSEVYRHIAFSNYAFIKSSGYGLPSDVTLEGGREKWDKMSTNRSEIANVLENSFDAVIETVKAMSDADLEKQIKVYGREMTLRNFMMSSLAHLHEHLGQSIAYARMNKVVPPWSARAEVSAKKK